MEKIIISEIKVFAYHGCLKEEKKIGTNYIADIVLEADLKEAAKKDDIQKTIDYTDVIKVVSQTIKKPQFLIETVANKIADNLLKKFNSIQKIEVSLKKTAPPVKGEVKSVGVIVSKQSKK